MSVEKGETPSVSKSDIDWLNDRIGYLKEDLSKANTKIKLLVRILVDKKIIGGELAKTFEESAKNPKIEWYEAKLWIQGAIKRKGALRSALGVKEGETIPVSVLNSIVSTETGKTISYKGKSITVTTHLKRQALLALKLKKMPKRGK